MKNPLKRTRTITTATGATRRRAGGAMATLASIALVAACGTAASGSTSSTTSSSSSDTSSSSSSSDDSSGTVWTTISSDVASASTGATVSDIVSANADTSEAVSATSDAENSGSWDTSSATTITLSGDSVSVSGDNADSVTVDGTTVTITGSGTFVLTGTLDDGEVVVDAADADVHLVLDGATITNNDGPAIDIEDAGTAVLVLADGTENSLTDGDTYSDTSDDAPTATLFSSDTLTITGTGSLDVTGNANDGISSKNGLVIQGNTTITVTAADDGIRGKDYLVISGGTITVDAGGDGLKSTEDDDETKGFVELGEATITITSGDDGINATTDVTVDGTTLTVTACGGQANASTSSQMGGGPSQQNQQDQSSSSDSSDSSSTDDGTVKAKGITAGVSYTQDSGAVTLDAADEGIQSAFININGGSLDIASGDDGVNATNGDYTIEGYENANSESDDGAYLTITGGEVQIDYANSDGIDSNGSASVTGGQVVIAGQAGSMDGSVDVNGDSTVNGITGSPSVAEGDTISVSSDDGTSWTLTSTISSDYITVIGLTEGTSYTVATSSGGSATGTAAALSAGGGMGGMGGR